MNSIRTFVADPVRRTVAAGILSGALITIYGLFLSRDHITFCGYAIRLTPLEAETLFIFVDVVAGFGKMLMSHRLVAKTRRIGRSLLIAGGSVSLICNVASGIMHHSIGAAVYGAGIVGLIAWLEYAVANIKGKAARIAKSADATARGALVVAPVARRKCEAGCTCGRHARKLTATRPTVTPARRLTVAASN